MKLLLIISVLLTTSAFAQYQPIEKLISAEHSYVPFGFDSNDNAEVIITGFLPNLCYKAPKAKVHINQGQIDVTLTALFYAPENGFCAEVAVPFIEVVNLGLLPQGHYEIKINQNSAHESRTNMLVAAAPNRNIDQFIYARVQYIEQVPGTRKVLLKGYNPSDCFRLNEIKYVSNTIDSYSIMPILTTNSDGFCPRKMVPFTYEFEVPNDINRAKVLLHVRSMDGRSVNAIYDNFMNKIQGSRF